MNSVLEVRETKLLPQGIMPKLYVVLVAISCWAFIATQSILSFIPIVLFLLGSVLLSDIRRIHLLLFLCIPLSTEVYLPMGLGTDLPTEQFMWLLTLIGGLIFIFNWNKIPAVYVYHPITILVLSMLGWVLITTVTSQNILQSFKYFLARSWYVIALFFMTLYFIKTARDVNRLFTYFFAGLLFSVFVILIRHGLESFTYDSINFVLWPFYRNHVNYACLLAISLPYFYWMATTRKFQNRRILLLSIFFVLLIALYFTYTRAAIIASVLCPIFYVIVRMKLVIHASLVAMVVAILLSVSMVRKYGYLAYAPNYETTIQHQNFDDVLSATYRLEDLSTMERFYRWIAGYRMMKERPLLGYGPANFYAFYRPFAVTSFTTYVSDNEDRSGIHNYYLMLLVEQGFPGLIIFIGLVLAAFAFGQKIYHRLKDKIEKRLILAALGSMTITLIISLMNDMLETDKVGTLFLFSLALLVRGTVLLNRQKSKTA